MAVTLILFWPALQCSVLCMTVFAHAVRLGAMLGFAQMDEESVTLLLSHVHDFLRYSNSLLSQFSLCLFCIATVVFGSSVVNWRADDLSGLYPIKFNVAQF